MDIRFLGHACFEITEGDKRVLIDPFLSGNPKAAAEASELEPTHLFLTHGHADHYGDIVDIAKRTGASVVALTEVAEELSGKLDDVSDPNLGGTIEFDGGLRVRMVPAWHTSTTPDGTASTPAGMVIGIGDRVVYHLGDTCLFSDLKLVKEREGKIDVALMCIGGHYTMDRHDAAVAAEWVGAETVIPCHYDTFPPVETDAQAFKADVEERTGGAVKVEVVEPGGTFSL